MAEEFDELEYYKELCEKEMEFSNRLNGKIGISITMLSVIGSGHVLLVSEMFPMVWELNWWNIISFVLWLVSVTIFGYTIFRFYKAYSGYTYGHFPIKGMVKTIDFGISLGMDSEATKKITHRLANQYKECAIRNRIENTAKSKNHLVFSRFTMVSFVSLALIFVCWFVFFKNRVSKPQNSIAVQVQIQCQDKPQVDGTPCPLLSTPVQARGATVYFVGSDCSCLVSFID